MDQNTMCIFLFFFLLGCSATLGEKQKCPKEDYQKCSDFTANVKDTKPETVCSITEKAEQCWQALQEKCEMDAEEKKLMDGWITKLNQSDVDCDKVDKVTPAATTCGDSAVENCNKLLDNATSSSSQNVSKCSLLDLVIDCTSAAVSNCMNETVKNSLTELHKSVEKNMTQMECCDAAAFKKCKSVQYSITNETVTQELCTSAYKTKSCVSTQLETCGDKVFKKPFETSLANIGVGLEVCEVHGFKQEGDAGTTIKPALVLLLCTCLMTVSKLF